MRDDAVPLPADDGFDDRPDLPQRARLKLKGAPYFSPPADRERWRPGGRPMAAHRPRGPAADRSRARSSSTSAVPGGETPALRPDLGAAPGPRRGPRPGASTGGSSARRASPSARPTPRASGTAADLPTLLRIAARDIGRADPLRRRIAPLAGPVPAPRLAADAQHAQRARARNIAAHYDLGNEMFELFLDREAMMYSCAYFETGDESARARPSTSASSGSATRSSCGRDDHLLEIGTGWGGMAVHAASLAGLPGDDDDDLRASSASTPRRGSPPPGLEDLRHRASAPTTATSRAPTTSSSRSR